MKSFITAALVATALALPEPAPQKGGGGAGGCKKVALLFARGTTEPGTMGSTVGPALSNALSAKFPGQVRAEGVRYPADMGGAVNGAINSAGAPGAIQMAKMAKAIMQSCPKTMIVLAGYSQGAEQVHGALAKANLGEDGAKIAAALTYGDPMAGPTTKVLGGQWGCLPEERAKVFCNKGDGVCTGAFSISAAHLSYTANGDVGKGASFAATIANAGKLGAPSGGCKFAPSGPELQAILCANPPKGKGGKGGKGGRGALARLLRRQGKGKGGKGGTPKLTCPPKDGSGDSASSAAPPASSGEE